MYVVNNTFLNDDSARGTFVFIGGAVNTPALLQNNIFFGNGHVANAAKRATRGAIDIGAYEAN